MPKLVQSFASWDWGNILRALGMLGTVVYLGLHLWNVQRDQLNDVKQALGILTVEVRNANTLRDDRIAAIKNETGIKLQTFDFRMTSLEGHQGETDQRLRENEAILSKLREQSATALSAVSQLRDSVRIKH